MHTMANMSKNSIWCSCMCLHAAAVNNLTFGCMFLQTKLPFTNCVQTPFRVFGFHGIMSYWRVNTERGGQICLCSDMKAMYLRKDQTGNGIAAWRSDLFVQQYECNVPTEGSDREWYSLIPRLSCRPDNFYFSSGESLGTRLGMVSQSHFLLTSHEFS